MSTPNAQRFTEFYRAHHGAALRYVRFRAPVGDGEALVEDAFLLTWQHLVATVWVPSSALFSAADGTPQLRVQAEGAAFEVFDVETGAPAGGWVPVVDPPPTLTAATRLLAGDA